MAEDLKGWSRPEEKFPEAELEDSFAEYFAEDHASVPGKKQRHRAGSEPDLLVETASEDDPGFVIEGLAAVEQSGATAESQEPDAEAESESEEEPEGPIPETVPACEVPEAENLPDEPFIEEEPGPSGETLSAQAAKSEQQPPEEPSAKEPAAEEPSAEESTEEVPTEEEPAIEEPPEEEAEKPETPVVSPAAKPKGHEIIKMTQNLLWNRRKHRWAAPVGLVVIILAVIGFIAVIIGGLNLGARVIDNTKEKEMFAWKVYPLLIFDPAAFDDPSQLDSVFLLKTALWKTLLENRTKYSYNDDGMLVVPASDLNVAAKSLYGDAVKLTHQTFSEGYEYYYIYDESTGTYLVPVMGQTAEYTPEVVRITKTEDTYTLLVGYVTQSTLWNMDTEGNMNETVPSKYMYYDLKKVDGDSYIITAVREVPAEEVPEIETSGVQQQLNETRYGEILENYNAASYNSAAENALGSGASESVSGESQTESAAVEESAVSGEAESALEESMEESAA
jgi:hypothetical protein